MSKRLNNEEVRDCILQAANQRFQTYGLVKTTMAEIAEDCNMSPANLYRHFKNKMDIVAHLAMQCTYEEEAIMNEVMVHEDWSAAQKLEEFVLAMLRYHHREWRERPKLSELVDATCNERPEIVAHKIATKTRLLINLLQQGNEQGEFAVEDDLEEVAESIQAATVLFSTPNFMQLFPLEEYEQKARNVVRLLLKGLLKS